MAKKFVDVSKLKEHYSWWSGSETMSEYKQIFDDIIDVQPEAQAEEIIHSAWSTIGTSEEHVLVECENCKYEYEIPIHLMGDGYQRCPHCGAHMV